jgi:hypothetical protein
MNTVKVNTHKRGKKYLVILLIIAVLLLGCAIAFFILGKNFGGKLLTQTMSEALGNATSVKIDIDPGDGNLMIDGFKGSEQVLASGTLQYLENKGLPTWSMNTSSGQATVTIKANGGQPWSRLPWSYRNGATEWQIHLNPNVPSDITAHSDGGNITLNLTGMAVTGVAADTGGGNIDVVLPDNAANLNVTAKTGAGNVTVQIPNGLAAKIHASSRLGKAIIAPQFIKIDDTTYQSPDFNQASDKVEITINSGAGNVSVTTK